MGNLNPNETIFFGKMISLQNQNYKNYERNTKETRWP